LCAEDGVYASLQIPWEYATIKPYERNLVPEAGGFNMRSRLEWFHFLQSCTGLFDVRKIAKKR
jgi:hypothetical protein